MIPITFNKDDLNNVKKGNVRGQDLASFLSISMPKEAGVLDIFDDPCGYVQITPTTGYATVTMKKGYVNIFGRCIYVEQGEQVQIALPENGSVTGTFGIRVNLGESGANEVTWFTKTTTLRQDNILNNEISGIYEFALYNYTATTSALTLTKVATVISNLSVTLNALKSNIEETIENLQSQVDNRLIGEEVELLTTFNTGTFQLGSLDNYKYLRIGVKLQGEDWVFTLINKSHLKSQLQLGYTYQVSIPSVYQNTQARHSTFSFSNLGQTITIWNNSTAYLYQIWGVK